MLMFLNQSEEWIKIKGERFEVKFSIRYFRQGCWSFIYLLNFSHLNNPPYGYKTASLNVLETYLLPNRGHRVEIRSPVRFTGGSIALIRRIINLPSRGRAIITERVKPWHSSRWRATRIVTLTSAYSAACCFTNPFEVGLFKHDREDAITGCDCDHFTRHDLTIFFLSLAPSFLQFLIYQQPLYDSSWS